MPDWMNCNPAKAGCSSNPHHESMKMMLPLLRKRALGNSSNATISIQGGASEARISGDRRDDENRRLSYPVLRYCGLHFDGYRTNRLADAHWQFTRDFMQRQSLVVVRRLSRARIASEVLAASAQFGEIVAMAKILTSLILL